MASALPTSTDNNAQAQGDVASNSEPTYRRDISLPLLPLSGNSANRDRGSYSLFPLRTQPSARPSTSTAPRAPNGRPLAPGSFGPAFLQGFSVKCTACEKNNNATAKCFECNSYLCARCLLQHTRARATSSHNIYHIDTSAERYWQSQQQQQQQQRRADTRARSSGAGNNERLEQRTNSRVVGAERGFNGGSCTDQNSSNSRSPPDESNIFSLFANTPEDRAVSESSSATAESGADHQPQESRRNTGGLPRATRSRAIGRGEQQLQNVPPTSSRVVGAERRTSGRRDDSPANSLTQESGYFGGPSRSTTISPTSTASMDSVATVGRDGVLSPCIDDNLASTVNLFGQDEAAAVGVLPNNSSGDAPNNMAVAVPPADPTICQRHSEEFMLFCSHCFEPACQACVRESHANHPLLFIPESMQALQEGSKKLNNEIREMNVNLRRSLDELQRMSEAIEYRTNAVSIDIKCTIRRYITALECRQDDVLQRLLQAREIKISMINFQMENVRLCYSNLARALDCISKPNQFVNPLQNLAANLTACKALNEARSLGSVVPLQDDSFSFMPPANDILQSIASLGTLRINCPSIKKSMMLCKQPLTYLARKWPSPKNPLRGAKSRPIHGCQEIVIVRDHGRFPSRIFGRTGSLPGDFCRPWGITINRMGNIIVTDRSNCRVQVFDSEGNYLFDFGSQGCEPGQFERPSALAVNPNDDMVVADKDNHRIQVFNRFGEFLFMFGERGVRIGQFMYPWDVACDSMGNILVSDTRNHRIQLFRWDGVFVDKFGGEPGLPRLFDMPRGVTFDPQGNIMLTDFNMHRVVIIDRITRTAKYVGREGRDRGYFNRPQGIFCDDRGWFIVADSRNSRIQVFNDKGELMWTTGRNGKKEPGEFDRPSDVTVDRKGHIWVMDFGNDRVQVF